jgi:hypothetical protein
MAIDLVFTITATPRSCLEQYLEFIRNMLVLKDTNEGLIVISGRRGRIFPRSI